jgi:hypothetical protein
MAPSDRAKLGKVGLTREEAIEAKAIRDERDLQLNCCQLLQLRGIEYIRPPMNRRSQLPPGWPDFTFAYCGRPCAWEVKVEEGKLRQEQIECLAKLKSSPNRWSVAIIRSTAEAKKFLDDIASHGEDYANTFSPTDG